jgi:hypothetical protein
MTKEQLGIYGEIMDAYLTAKDVKIVISMPAGTQEASVETNLDYSMGPLVAFYAALHAVDGCARKLARALPQGYDVAQFADNVASMVAETISEGLTAEAQNDRKRGA